MHDDEMIDCAHAWQPQGRPKSRDAVEHTPAFVDKPPQPEPNQF